MATTTTTPKPTPTTKSKPPAAEECIVCCEPSNKTKHLLIECEHVACKYNACRECVRSYLLISASDPHCMECKTNWSPRFMLILNKNWLSDIYRPHREKLLCDIELSKITETMPAAERYKSWQAQQQICEEIRAEWIAHKAQTEKLLDKYNAATRLAHNIKSGKEEEKVEKKEFFMSCPAVNCNGMLSTQYKCGICDIFACKECNECIGMNKTAEHTCDPNNVASAQAIKKETKQCPGCHNRIYRVEGCSQMWCTGCHTAFDWNTGKKVVSGRLHNPHWLEYQRGLNGGTAPRAPGDVPCGGICSRSAVNQQIVVKINMHRQSSYNALYASDPLVDTLRSIHRIVENITLNHVRELRDRLQTLVDFKTQRVKYIVGEITKAELSTQIFKADKVRQKNTEMLNVYELLSAVGIDMFNRLLANTKRGEDFIADVTDQVKQYDTLRTYCNGLFAIISNTYGMVVPQINKSWSVLTERFNSKTMKELEPSPSPSVSSPASSSSTSVV